MGLLLHVEHVNRAREKEGLETFRWWKIEKEVKEGELWRKTKHAGF